MYFEFLIEFPLILGLCLSLEGKELLNLGLELTDCLLRSCLGYSLPKKDNDLIITTDCVLVVPLLRVIFCLLG